ncbi:MAG: CPBP family intramembrane metalloprotease [Candidatus Bathyarchaeota archaeon]|nr:CPBP family intramembrane metalloprotease [Candidatus Bathyarchaeota archaeon]
MKGEIELPLDRETSWRTVLTLALMQLLGNLAAIPLNASSVNGVTESLFSWFFWTFASILIIWVAVFLSGKVGLGAPIIEGYLPREKRPDWIREVASFTTFGILVTLPLYLSINMGITKTTYPPCWQLVLASIQAGVREEIFSRLLLMSLFIFVGKQLTKDDARPNNRTIWVGTILSAAIFGLAHFDNTPYSPEILVPLLGIFTGNALLGLLFGWLYWRYGLEAAMLSHFLFDAVGSALVVPVYLWGSLVSRITLSLVLILFGIVSLYQLKHNRLT